MKRLLFGLLLAAVIAVEHQTLGKRWQKYELLRRLLGIGTVLACSYPVARQEQDTQAGWLAVAGGFVIAGAVKVALDIKDGLIRFEAGDG